MPPVAVVQEGPRPRAAGGLPGGVRGRGEGAVRGPHRVRQPPPVQGAAGGGRGGARALLLRGGRAARAALRRRRVRARRGGDRAGDGRGEDHGRVRWRGYREGNALGSAPDGGSVVRVIAGGKQMTVASS